MATDQERIAQLEEQNALLVKMLAQQQPAGPIDYMDDSIDIDQRIAAAEAAGDITASFMLKKQRMHDAEPDLTTVDFRREGDDLSLREQIAEADAAGDAPLSIARKLELSTALTEHGQSGTIARGHEIQRGIQAAIAARQEAAVSQQSGHRFGLQEPGKVNSK